MFLLDANVFIQAKNAYYAPEIAPGFWDLLDIQFANGKIASVEKVYKELIVRDDWLAVWVKERKKFFFQDDNSIVETLTEISNWTEKVGYDKKAKDDFIRITADYYLIAHAMAKQYTVVTHEIGGSGSKKKIKIPDVCKVFNIPCINSFELIKKLEMKLVLQK
jgi:hypothetical protein